MYKWHAMHPSPKRAREFHDLMERYIETRRRAFLPRVRAMAADAGLAERDLLFIGYTRQVSDGDRIPVALLRRRACYSTAEPWRTRLGTLEAAGLVRPEGDDWVLTSSGREVVSRFWREDAEHRTSLGLPAEPLHRVVGALEAAVRDRTAGPGDRLTSIRRTAPADRDRQHDAVRAEQAMFELAVTLDDGHIRAWQAAGYPGPVLDVLTQVWYGKTDRAGLHEALSTKQPPQDVDRHVTELERRGDLRVDGDGISLTDQGRAAREAIEAETDRIGLGHWPQGEDLERLIGDLAALVDALPPEDQLPAGPTH